MFPLCSHLVQALKREPCQLGVLNRGNLNFCVRIGSGTRERGGERETRERVRERERERERVRERGREREGEREVRRGGERETERESFSVAGQTGSPVPLWGKTALNTSNQSTKRDRDSERQTVRQTQRGRG